MLTIHTHTVYMLTRTTFLLQIYTHYTYSTHVIPENVLIRPEICEKRGAVIQDYDMLQHWSGSYLVHGSEPSQWQ